jgi:hypothetical protein
MTGVGWPMDIVKFPKFSKILLLQTKILVLCLYFFNSGLITFRSKQYLYTACFSLVERKIRFFIFHNSQFSLLATDSVVLDDVVCTIYLYSVINND